MIVITTMGPKHQKQPLSMMMLIIPSEDGIGVSIFRMKKIRIIGFMIIKGELWKPILMDLIRPLPMTQMGT